MQKQTPDPNRLGRCGFGRGKGKGKVDGEVLV
jgi:hypothetical protein